MNQLVTDYTQFFVTLWEQLQTRARRTDGDGDITSGMSYENVKDRTSADVGSDGDGGILFDETIAAYTNRRKSAEEYLVAALIDSNQKAFRPYLSKSQWTTISDDSHGKARCSKGVSFDLLTMYS